MSRTTMRLGLRAGERLYINGAVIRVDRKVAIELLNDVSFLLEAHVMQPEETTTPLRQLYFAVQMILMDSAGGGHARRLADQLMASLNRTLENGDILAGLATTATQLGNNRVFDALKTIRGLFPTEARVLAGDGFAASLTAASRAEPTVAA
jgi:flagellar protein FlbT